jgi:hypothetical protein
MDERRTLTLFGWVLGSIVIGSFVLSAVAMN